MAHTVILAPIYTNPAFGGCLNFSLVFPLRLKNNYICIYIYNYIYVYSIQEGRRFCWLDLKKFGVLCEIGICKLSLNKFSQSVRPISFPTQKRPSSPNPLYPYHIQISKIPASPVFMTPICLLAYVFLARACHSVASAPEI